MKLIPNLMFCIFLVLMASQFIKAAIIHETPIERIKHSSLSCGKGEYQGKTKGGQFSCYPCPENKYQDEANHVSTGCKTCKTDDEHIHFELKVKNCTSTSDAVFVCVDNYYRRGIDKECKRCSVCSLEKHKYIGQNCTNTTDTVCCEHPNMDVVERKSQTFKDFVCVNQTVPLATSTPPTTATSTATTTKNMSRCESVVFHTHGCQAGEYRVTGCETPHTGVLCKPCVEGSFMNETHHENTKCKKCSKKPTNYDEISPCNGTHDSVYTIKSDSSGLTAYGIVLIIIGLCLVVVSIIGLAYKICRSKEGTSCTNTLKGILSKVRPSPPRSGSLSSEYFSVPHGGNSSADELEL